MCESESEKWVQTENQVHFCHMVFGCASLTGLNWSELGVWGLAMGLDMHISWIQIYINKLRYGYVFFWPSGAGILPHLENQLLGLLHWKQCRSLLVGFVSFGICCMVLSVFWQFICSCHRLLFGLVAFLGRPCSFLFAARLKLITGHKSSRMPSRAKSTYQARAMDTMDAICQWRLVDQLPCPLPVLCRMAWPISPKLLTPQAAIEVKDASDTIRSDPIRSDPDPPCQNPFHFIA